jgi:hypothetical protein
MAAINVTVIALLLAGVGFVVQMIAGVTDTPTVPPGLVAIVAAAVLVAVVRTTWAPIAGPVAGLFNLLAMVAVGAVDRLVDPSPASGFLGAWTMFLGLIAATIAGTLGAAAGRLENEQQQNDDGDDQRDDRDGAGVH